MRTLREIYRDLERVHDEAACSGVSFEALRRQAVEYDKLLDELLDVTAPERERMMRGLRAACGGSEE